MSEVAYKLGLTRDLIVVDSLLDVRVWLDNLKPKLMSKLSLFIFFLSLPTLKKNAQKNHEDLSGYTREKLENNIH